ncbi:MAG TPA: hypothetical protein PLZ51_07195, partial [Aggregatilineales bacterium]|nr:hypothetical protein [Aggregatilineales bacterium]
PIMRREPNIKALAGEWFGKDWEAIARANWDKIDDLNFIFFRKKSGYDCDFDEITREVINPECDGIESDADDFETAFIGFLKTLREHPDHSRKHTRYLLRAEEWKATGEREDNLLIGREIAEAEAWLSAWETSKITRQGQNLPPIEPKPLPLHSDFISASRVAENMRTAR